MKNILFSILTLFISLNSQAQFFGKLIKGNGKLIHQTQQTESYDEIIIGGSFDVELYNGKEGKIDLSMEENLIQFLEINVTNRTLNINWKKNTKIKTTISNKIKVPVEKINKIQLTGSGDINSKEVLENVKIIVNLVGSGNISLNLSTNEVEGNLVGSGNIQLLGTTVSENFVLSGSGNIETYNLKSSNSDSKITGSGRIELYTTDSFVGRISGSGAIYFKGNPKVIDKKVTGSGNIQSR